MKKRIVLNSFMVLAAVVLLLPVAPVVAAAPPVVNGLFYGDGDNNDYILLSQNPGRGDLYYYQDGNTLYLAVVVSTNVNDNVFGNMSLAADKAYVQSVGWKGQANQHTAKALIDSENMELNLQCNGQSWIWRQDYVYPSGNTWLSDPLGVDGSGAWPAVLLASASSLAWNLNNTTWNYTQGGSNNTWKSVDANANNSPWDDGYGTYNAEFGWEWPLVYEMSLDVSACNDSWAAQVLSAHNSPPKDGDPDIPIPLRDYGDAPDSYNTYRVSNGASHALLPGGPILGTIVDAESTSAFPDACACSDDVTGVDDEDGVGTGSPILPTFNRNQWNTLQVYSATGGRLDAWIDFDGNGVFDALDKIADSIVLSAGENFISFFVPANATEYDTWARFRISTAGGLGPTGPALDGEVEDYRTPPIPTAVELISFAAKAKKAAIVLTWETASEIDTLGFNVYRAESAEGVFTKLNASLIPSQVPPGSPIGAVYSFVDGTAQPGVRYYYKLEDVDIYGRGEFHGPVDALMRPRATQLSRSSGQ